MTVYNRNTSGVSANLDRGWRDRASKATNKAALDASWRDVDAVRQAYYAEQRRIAQDEQDERHRRQGLKVCCPVCDSGAVAVELAEKVYRALEALPAHSTPDALKLAALVAVASGLTPVEAQIVHSTHGLTAPRKVSAPVAMPIHDAPGDDADALVAYVREQTAREAEIAALSRPVTEAEAAAVDAADQDAVLAAVEAADPAPVTVTTPTKHRTRRVPAAPFLQGDE